MGLIFFGYCSTIKEKSTKDYAIERISTFWIKNDNRYTPIVITEKVWLKDSIGITQICGIFTTEKEKEVSTNIRTVGYRMVNLRKKWAYEYSDFSDTAKILRKFSYNDTTQVIGGWNFTNPKPIQIQKFIFLPDTIINSSILKQGKVTFNFNGISFGGYCLFNCQMKGRYFELDQKLSKKGGCPLVYFSSSPITDSNAKFEQEIKYVSDSFSDSVNKVFIAWRRNENIN